MIASACVFNNVIDRDIDAKMLRTKRRALAAGTISPKAAAVYASLLGVSGFLVLATFTNLLVVSLGLLAMFSYIVLYGIAKRRSVHGTLVGSLAGAMPPVAGYLAASNKIDLATVILFLILVCWQMPHFYAISIYRLKDYKAAGLPVLPAKAGIRPTKLQILCYIVVFIVTASMLSIFDYTGLSYLAVIVGLGLYWFWLGTKGFKTTNNINWARGMFFFSLIVILALGVMISLGTILP